jgi:proteasome accessory factor C
VPWIAAHDGPTVAEVCDRFDITEKDLTADLNLLFLCGVYPFTPDVLIDVTIAGGRVWITMADYFRRPLRLTSREALALVAVGRFYLRMPGGDANTRLASALAKLAAALGLGGDEAVEIDLDATPAGLLASLRDAVASRSKVDLTYYSFGRDATTRRVVHPWKVLNVAGHWYLSAWCETAQAERMFRLDRILEAAATAETFGVPAPSPPRQVTPGVVYNPTVTDASWVVELGPDARWVAELYPNEEVEDLGEGRLRVRLRAAEKAWMERLLLRAGGSAAVIEGDTDLASSAARRVLRRYQRNS